MLGPEGAISPNDSNYSTLSWERREAGHSLRASSALCTCGGGINEPCPRLNLNTSFPGSVCAASWSSFLFFFFFLPQLSSSSRAPVVAGISPPREGSLGMGPPFPLAFSACFVTPVAGGRAGEQVGRAGAHVPGWEEAFSSHTSMPSPSPVGIMSNPSSRDSGKAVTQTWIWILFLPVAGKARGAV